MPEQEEVDSFESWMRDRVRAERQLERRVQALSMDDELGAGFDVYAHQVVDWNTDEALGNGFFWSDAGAINTPDNSVIWYGTVTATDSGGAQRVSGISANEPQEFHRVFSLDTNGTTPTFSDWVRTDGRQYWQQIGDQEISSTALLLTGKRLGWATPVASDLPGVYGVTIPQFGQLPINVTLAPGSGYNLAVGYFGGGGVADISLELMPSGIPQPVFAGSDSWHLDTSAGSGAQFATTTVIMPVDWADGNPTPPPRTPRALRFSVGPLAADPVTIFGVQFNRYSFTTRE